MWSLFRKLQPAHARVHSMLSCPRDLVESSKRPSLDSPFFHNHVPNRRSSKRFSTDCREQCLSVKRIVGAILQPSTTDKSADGVVAAGSTGSVTTVSFRTVWRCSLHHPRMLIGLGLASQARADPFEEHWNVCSKIGDIICSLQVQN